jgi:CII-binding regulator of phage lambda lysogenization HflD
MPLDVNDLEILKNYINGVMDRSEHHAKSVRAVSLALIGAVLWRKDAEPLQVRTHAGETANILWFQVGGERYALAYNHKRQCIELRERTQNGRAIAQFDNDTTMREVRKTFKNLGPKQ